MGALYNGTCYADSNAATEAMYFSPSFSTITPGATTYYQIPVMIGADVHLQGWTISSTGVQTAKWTKPMPITLFPTCDVFGSVTDLSTAWMAGFTVPMACFLLAYSIGRLVSMFNSDHG